MFSVWVYPVLSVLLVSLFSFVGVLTLFKDEPGKNELMGLVAFSAGGLMGLGVLLMYLVKIL